MDTPDYGRQSLRKFGFPIRGGDAIEPGTFLIGNGEPCGMKPVTAGAWPYVAIALDHPIRADSSAMLPSNRLGAGSQPLVGSMGEYAWTPQSRPRIGHDLADRAFDLAVALEELLDRFHADPKHAQTGFLAESHDAVPHVQYESYGDVVRTRNLPNQAHEIFRGSGWVYASHFQSLDPPQWVVPEVGYAGALTLMGQIECLAAVLRDRLAELIADKGLRSGLSAMPRLVGRTHRPVDWNETARSDLESVRGELWLWKPQPGKLQPTADESYELAQQREKPRPVYKPDGWTRAELIAQAESVVKSLSTGRFDTIRKRAGITSSERGGKGAQRRFSNTMLRRLIKEVRARKYRNGSEIIRAWEELLPVPPVKHN